MMNYIQKTATGITVSNKQVTEINIGLTAYLNMLCEPYLKTVDSIRSIIKKKHNIKTNIPIVINPDICFVLTCCIRSHEVILVNIHEIHEIIAQNHQTKIRFYNDELILDIPKHLFLKRLQIARDVSSKLCL